MNEWQKDVIENDPFNEICDCCGKEIRNWDWMEFSFLAKNGVDILCKQCNNTQNENQTESKVL